MPNQATYYSSMCTKKKEWVQEMQVPFMLDGPERTEGASHNEWGPKPLDSVLYLRESLAPVNQHPPAHHAGWMMCGQKTFFHCIPVP